MTYGATAVQPIPKSLPFQLISHSAEENEWTFDQHTHIVQALRNYGCEYLKGRDEYALLKQVLISNSFTEVTGTGNPPLPESPLFTGAPGSGVNSSLCGAIVVNDTTSALQYNKPFLAPLDLQKAGSISDAIPSFKVIQSKSMSLNIGFDTEFQDYRNGFEKNRRVLSLQMSIAIGYALIRYFFLVTPWFQEVTEEGGKIPLKYCLADVLADLKKCYFPDFPLVLKRDIRYQEKKWSGHDPVKIIDFKAMKDSLIPVTIICHTGKADISVFRRSKYDIDLLRKLGEIQGGWMTTEKVRFKAENDRNYN